MIWALKRKQKKSKFHLGEVNYIVICRSQRNKLPNYKVGESCHFPASVIVACKQAIVINASVRAFLRHGCFLGTGVSSARAFLRHERFFGRSVSSAGAFLQQEHFFGTNVSSAPAFLRSRESTKP